VDARGKVRSRASATGFSSWTDELGLDDWLTGDIFGRDELPVLFAHGHHNQPDAMVLATTEYRRAYAGKLARVLARLVESMHLVWIGFSFTDGRIDAVLREVAESAGTRIDPGRANRHIAVMGWDPASGDDPQTLRGLAEIQWGADLVLYPTPDGDHSALQRLLATFTDPAYPPVPAAPAVTTSAPAAVAAPAQKRRVRWVPDVEVVAGFTGRVEELARLDRWAADPGVRLVGVSAWGGAGKTALVSEWVRRGGASRRAAPAGVRGVFGWSFYADPSAEHWLEGLLGWAREALGVVVAAPAGSRVRPVDVVLTLLRKCPLVLVLDGLEVVQEGPGTDSAGGGGFGRFLDGVLREVLTGVCRVEHAGLVVLTSRFPFADLEGFDGGAARMLEVPPFTPAEGATLLAGLGAGWVDPPTRRGLSTDVDGHALALSALAGVLSDRSQAIDVAGLRAELVAAGRTDGRVAKVLSFYADRLPERDRWLAAAVSLFARPVGVDALAAVAGHEVFAGRLDGLTAAQVRAAAVHRMSGLLSWHPDGTVSAHPLVRAAFRPLALGAADVAADASLSDIPGVITTREEGLRVVEAIELLLDADQWQPADDLHTARAMRGDDPVWKTLPAARLGLRAAAAFVGTAQRRSACPGRLPPDRLGFYLISVGLFASYAGDLATAADYLQAGVDHIRAAGDQESLSIGLRNVAETLAWLGRLEPARAAAGEALTLAREIGDREQESYSIAYLGWVADLAGDTLAAEAEFTAADRIAYADDPYGDHLISRRGVLWAEFLARTGRTGPAQRLTERNRQVSIEQGWNENVARCDRVLARLALTAGDPGEAVNRAAAAAAMFRDGEYLLELAQTLPVLADASQAAGDLEAAHRHATEAIDLAGPRGNVPAHTADLAARARVHAARAASETDPAQRDVYLGRARDDADAARTIATRHGLAWHELDALDVHTALDQLAGTNTPATARAAALRARLIPPGLDPDPPATIERLVADEKRHAEARETADDG
jgi:tetratricopeptide (TPR) repeat protein